MTKYILTLIIFFAGKIMLLSQYSNDFLKGKWINKSSEITISFYQNEDETWNAIIIGLKENVNLNDEP